MATDKKVGGDEGDEAEVVLAIDADGKPIDPPAGTQLPKKAEAKKPEPEDDESEDDDDDKPKGDARVGHEEDEESPEERSERRRAERREKKLRQREYRERQQRENQFLLARNEELEKTVSQINGRVTMTEAAAIDNRIEQIKQQVQLAEDVMAKAIDAQDGATHKEAMRIRDDLMQSQRRLEAARQERIQSAQAPLRQAPAESAGSPSQGPKISPRHAELAQEFLSKNPWYDPAAGDEDSAIAQAVDARVRAEGMDPATPAYWAELTKRLKKRLPERFAQRRDTGDAGDDDDDDLDDEPPRSSGRKPEVRRDAPTFPAAGRSRQPKQGEVYVSPERKAAMIEHGVWEDPKLRQKMLRRYQQWDQENARK